MVIPYAPTIHWLSARETKNWVLIEGRATWMMEKSTTSRKTAAIIRAKINRVWAVGFQA